MYNEVFCACNVLKKSGRADGEIAVTHCKAGLDYTTDEVLTSSSPSPDFIVAKS